MNREARDFVIETLLSAGTVVTANTSKRVRYVWPALTSGQKVALLNIVFNAIGMDDWEEKSDWNNRTSKMNWSGFSKEYAQKVEELLEWAEQNGLQGNNLIDPYIPWLAKSIRSEDAPLGALWQSFRAICLWASETKTDLGKVTVVDALEKAKSYVPRAARKALEESDANPVVYRFADGFRVFNLKTPEALEHEGDRMKHCVGTYCEAVGAGDSVIYSIRSPDNDPEKDLTLEYRPGKKTFTQMFGVGDRDAEPWQKKYIIEFIEAKFPHDKLGLLRAGKLDTLRGADLKGANLRRMNLERANLSGANLSGANLSGADLTEAIFRGAVLAGTIFKKTTLTGADFEGTDLHSAIFSEAELGYAYLMGANLRGLGLEYANLKKARLHGADLTGAILRAAHFEGSILQDAILRDADLTGAYLSGADLSGADLSGANLSYANLVKADLSGADLSGADLSGAELDLVKHDSETIWPTGFELEPRLSARTVSAVHYEDIYPRGFIEFRKKYLKLLKSPERHDLWVQFTNFAPDPLQKNPHKDPDHRDPVGIYGYPLEYVLKHPADIWYGGQAKYLRVLKGRKQNKALRLQYVDWSEARSLLYKMGFTDGEELMEKAKALWPERIGKNSTSVARMFFSVVQMKLEDVEVPRNKDKRREVAKNIAIRSGQEQTALLRKAGFDEVIDSAKNNKNAVINDREPEQVIFLHRHAFDVIETFVLGRKTDKGGVGTAQDQSQQMPRLAALIATGLSDKIVDREVNYSSGTFWTLAGREIRLSFDRPSSYYEGKKMGEKKHKESRLESSYLASITVETERGPIKFTSRNQKFEELADEVQQDFQSMQGQQDPDWKPITRALRKEQEDARKAAYYEAERKKKAEENARWVPKQIEYAKKAAQRLGVPFEGADFWNSSDAVRDEFLTILQVYVRSMRNAFYRVKNESNDWNFFDKVTANDFEEATKSVWVVGDYDYVGDDGKAWKSEEEKRRAQELIGLLRACFEWQLKTKTADTAGSPDAYFEFLVRDMEEKEPSTAQALEAAAELIAHATKLLG